MSFAKGIFAIIFLAVSPVAFAAEPSTRSALPKLTPGKETTGITGPLNADGTVNYAEALNQRYSQGVTADNNAAIPFLRILGIELIAAPEARDLIAQRLGVDAVPSDQAPWITPERFYNIESRTRRFEASTLAAFQKQFDDDLKYACAHLWIADDLPDLGAFLQRNASALSLLDAACQRSRYFMPALRPATELQFFPFSEEFDTYYIAGRVFAARATFRLRAGDADGSLRDVIAAHRLARLIGQGPSTIHRLRACGMLAGVHAAVAAAARSGRLTAAQAHQWIKELDALPALPDLIEMVDIGWRWETLKIVQLPLRAGGLDALAHLWKQGGPNGGETLLSRRLRDGWKKADWEHLDFNAAAQRCNVFYDRIVAAMRLRPVSAVQRASKVIEAELAQFQAAAEEAIAHDDFPLIRHADETPQGYAQRYADILLKICADPGNQFVETAASASMRFDLTRLALAVEGYKAEHGEVPGKLAELVPGYLSSIPVDEFNGRPLIYKITESGYLIYSVGINLVDDGGVLDRKANKDDIVVSGTAK